MKIRIEVDIDDSMISSRDDLSNVIRTVGACVDQGLLSGSILNEKTNDESGKWQINITKGG